MNNRFLTFLLFFLTLYFTLSFFTKTDEQSQSVNADIEISTKDEWVIGQLVVVNIKNNSSEELVLSENQYPPESLSIEQWFNGRWEKLNIQEPETDFGRTVIKPQEKLELNFSAWNKELFAQPGKYRIAYLGEQDQIFASEFTLEQAGFFRSIWRAFFFKPIFNILIFFVAVFPGHNLALAILILTLLIKLALLSPSKKALVQQQKMQKVQKELELIRKKYASDQQKLAQETMALWKKHGINPMGSFLPIFIQFPVMIALFYVVKDGLLPHNEIFLWPPLKDFDLTMVNNDLFGVLDLSSGGVWWLAILVGLLQFVTMKLNTWHRDKKKDKDVKKDKSDDPQSQMEIVNTMMTYGLPVMIAFFTISMPAAVGFYWGVSTLFSIGQQYFLQKSS